MSAADATIRATALRTGYRTGRTSTTVTEASFTWEAGHIIALVGPNGAGKTTLLRTLVGVLAPLGGALSVGGLAVSEYRQQHGIGYLPEQLVLADDWTGVGLLALAAAGSGLVSEQFAMQALATAGVDFPLDQPVRSMSKGMRQRLGLAMALVPEPRVLLLDEPEAGLDPGQRVRLRDHVREYARAGRLVVVASHDLTGLCTIADHAFVLRDAGLLHVDPAEFRDALRVSQLFSGGR